MVIGEGSEQAEGILLTMTRVEDYDFVFAGVVVILIKGMQLIDTEIWVHAANTINKDVWASIVILDVDMVDDTLMQELHELRAMGIACQGVLRVLCLRRVSLFFFQLILQHAGMLQEFFMVEELTKLLE